MDIQRTLKQGIQAAKRGEREQAQSLFETVLEADYMHLSAWLWLSRVVTSVTDKEICFEQILALDADNEYAHRGLVWVQQQRQSTAQPVGAHQQEMTVVDEAKHIQKSQAIMSSEGAIEKGYIVEDEFDAPNLCPFCAAQASEFERVCPVCKQPLIVRKRQSLARSVWLWRGFFVQAYTASYILIAGLAYFVVMAKLGGVPNPLLVLPLYVGIPVDRPTSEWEIALNTLSRLSFWLLVGTALYALLLMLILYVRFPYGHLLYLTNAGLMLALGLVGLIFGTGWLMAVLSVIGIGIGQIVITRNLWADFTFHEVRLALGLDVTVKGNADALFQRASYYANLKMWGNAVLHLRHAVGLKPHDTNYLLSLVVAYINIKRSDLAEKSLTDLEKIDPHSSDAKKLRQAL